MPVAVTAAGVVLAGGASSRMGTDKAFVQIDGRPMVLRVVDALRAAGCDPVTCQGGDADRLAHLGLVVCADDVAAGPARAIASALGGASAGARSTGAPSTLVIAACDLPDLTAQAVGSLLRVSVDRGVVAVAAAGGRRHLVAAWPVAARDAVADAIDRGVRSYGELLAEVAAIDVPVDAATVRNVNRPEDLPGRALGRRYPRCR